MAPVTRGLFHWMQVVICNIYSQSIWHISLINTKTVWPVQDPVGNLFAICERQWNMPRSVICKLCTQVRNQHHNNSNSFYAALRCWGNHCFMRNRILNFYHTGVILFLCGYWLGFNSSLSLSHACIHSKSFHFHSPYIWASSFTQESRSHWWLCLSHRALSSGCEAHRTCQLHEERSPSQRSNQTHWFGCNDRRGDKKDRGGAERWM